MDDVISSVECVGPVSGQAENPASPGTILVPLSENHTASNQDTTSGAVDVLDDLPYRHMPFRVIGERQIGYTAAEPMRPRPFLFQENDE